MLSARPSNEVIYNVSFYNVKNRNSSSFGYELKRRHSKTPLAGRFRLADTASTALNEDEDIENVSFSL